MDKQEPKFVNGLIVKRPNPKAPDFVKANLSIKRKELLEFLEKETDDWINVDVKESKKGGLYAQVNDWKPKPQQPLPTTKDDGLSDINVDDIAF